MSVEARGLRFAVRPGTSDAQAVKEVIEQHSYTRRYFQIAAGEKWLDLGANIGAFSCLALQAGATVEAYEPEPGNAERARQNIALNGFVAPVHQQAVVADACGEAALRFYLSNTAYGQWRHSLYKTKGRRCIIVPTVTISTILPGADAVKMDIEGAEIDILYTIADWQQVRKLCFEYHFDVNKSIPLFRHIIDRLRAVFPNVRGDHIAGDAEEYIWYPPARVVLCWR